MINPVLTYLHDFYGDGQFHDLTPLMQRDPSNISETYIHNLHLEGLIELQEPSAFEGSKNPEHIHSIYGRLTEQGSYYMEGAPKIAAIINAINNQLILDLIYKDEKGHEETVVLSPYVYGKDTEEKPTVWGLVLGEEEKKRRFLLDQITITEKPVGNFTVNKDMMLSQPRDIDVVAQVQY